MILDVSSPAGSVCIPTRNRADELAELLAALAAQTWDDMEVVVVDDGVNRGVA